MHVLARDILEKRNEIDFLLVVAAERREALLPDNGYHRLVIEPCIIETIQQVDGSGAGGCQANADLAGELGMGTGHECGHLLMANLNEVEFVAGAIERRNDAGDAISGKTENPSEFPLR